MEGYSYEIHAKTLDLIMGYEEHRKSLPTSIVNSAPQNPKTQKYSKITKSVD